MLKVTEISVAQFEEAERAFETTHEEMRFAVASTQAVGFYESIKDYNDNAAIWVAWFDGEQPADLAEFIRQEIQRAEDAYAEDA